MVRFFILWHEGAESAINAKELEVTFNKAVSPSTVVASAFTITKNNGTSVSISTAPNAIKVSEDGRSAKILLASGSELDNNDILKVEVTKDVILTSSYDKFEGATFSDIKFTDTVSPKLLSAVATDSTTVELTFDEPVDWTTNSGGVSVNGAALVAGANNTSAGNYTYTFTVPTLKTGANTVQLINYADFAGNKDALTTTTVNYAADTSVPEVQSIKAVDSTSFILTLNKVVDTIANTNLTVKKGNYTFTSSTLTVEYVDADGNLTADITGVGAADGTTPSKYVKVTVPTQAGTINPLYDTNENSVALAVNLTGYKNGSLLGKEYSGSVTLSKDLVAPKVVSSKLVTFDKAAKTITIPFDKNISIADAVNYLNYITVMNGSVKEPVTAVTSGKNLVITVTGGLTDATYNIVLDKGLVKDSSNNVNEASVLSTTVSSAAATVQMSSSIFTNGFTNHKNVITASYGVKVDDSAAQASSYLLNGAALPAGSVVYFTDGDKDTVNIELPSSYAVSIDDLSAKVTLKANTVKVADTLSTDYGKTVSSSASEAKDIDAVLHN